eukprot:gene19572-23448_t
MSTGLVDQSRQVASENQNTDYFKVNQQFSNIIEMMKMKKTMSVLSYNLILHDLMNPGNAFKDLSPEVKKLSQKDRSEVIGLYKEKLLTRSVLTPVDSGKYGLYELVVSMGYDEINLNKKLSVYRIDNSDFINVEYLSANPLLSAFVVNTLSEEFINSYSTNVSSNQNKSISVLDSLVKKKEAAMNAKNSELKNYKINNGVLNLDKQSEIIYKQITDYEERKSQALREIQSNMGAIADLNRKLNGKDKSYLGSAPVAENTAIVSLNNQLKTASNHYVDNGFKPSDKKKIDSLQALLAVQMNKVSDNYVNDPGASKQSLIQQKNTMEIAVSMAQSSLKSIDGELNQLKAKYNTMVPFDAGVQNYERDADVATKEYMDALNRFNQTNVEKSIGLKLQIAQIGLPGPPEPSKKIIYMALSDYVLFKDLMRSLRFEISKMLQLDAGSKILGITSIKPGEGKTFLTSTLAYAFAMTGKKVLLIGDDYTNRETSDSKALITSQYFENFLQKKEIKTEDLITFLNKNSSSKSLLEIQNSTALKAGFDYLKDKFDLILIDVDSLRSVNKAKEWLSFTDHSLAVFEAGQSINDSDKEFLTYIRKQDGFIGWVLNKVKVKELRVIMKPATFTCKGITMKVWSQENRNYALAFAGIAFSALVAFFAFHFGVIVPILFTVSFLGVIYLMITVRELKFAYYGMFFYCFMVIFLYREISSSVPFGTGVEVFILIAWISVLFNPNRIRWKLLNNDLVYLALFWFFLSVIELVNPAGASARGWLQEIRSSALYFIFITPLGDAGQFGASQAHICLIAAVLALGPFLWWKRMLLAIAAVILLYGMLISGTRGALFALIVGGFFALFLSKNFKVLFFGGLVAVMCLGVLKYTTIGNGNYQIYRLRTALDPQDPSLNVRFTNQLILRDYLSTRPFGGGLGVIGTWGKEYNKDKFLSTIEPDSYWVKVWVMYGIVGFVIWFGMIMYIIGKCCGIVWKIRDVKLKVKLIALTSGTVGVFFCSYGNEVMNTMPTALILYMSWTFIYLGPLFDKKEPAVTVENQS